MSVSVRSPPPEWTCTAPLTRRSRTSSPWDEAEITPLASTMSISPCTDVTVTLPVVFSTLTSPRTVAITNAPPTPLTRTSSERPLIVTPTQEGIRISTSTPRRRPLLSSGRSSKRDPERRTASAARLSSVVRT